MLKQNIIFKIPIELIVLKLQCFFFVILWIVWPLPHTTALRNICLVCGAFLSLYQLWTSRNEYSLQNSKAPLFLIGSFFLWIHFHLFYLSIDWKLQFSEYISIWKSALLSFIFGVGLAFGLKKWATRGIKVWLLVGLSLSMMIYFIKLLATVYISQHLDVPEYILLYKGAASFYVPKISYVFFLMPIFAIFLSLINQFNDSSNDNAIQRYFLFAQILGLTSILLIFLLENIKNGIFYSTLLALLFYCNYIFKNTYKSIKSYKLIILILLTSLAVVLINIEQNRSWQNFFSDFKIAIKVDQYSNWYDGKNQLPLNEKGESVSGTNYDRISWAIIGMRLLNENPLGYGLVDRSFRHLAQKVWPESSLAQSHSGWIDFSLGVGVPGALLVLLTFLFGLKGCRDVPDPYKTIIWSIVIGIILLFISTEVSQSIYIAGLFLIMGATIGFGIDKLKP